MSIKANPDKRDLRYVKLVSGRRQGRSEDEIAASEGYGSPMDLYRQIAEDGHPICPVCGTTYVKEGHCKTREYKRERQARSSSPAKDLPPASAATEFFREAIDVLTRAVENLQYVTEVSQGGRFVATYVNKEPVHLPRSSFSDEEWRKLCELYDHDPEAEVFVDTNANMTNPVGAAPIPPRPLVLLIATYALTNQYLGPLLKALHPNPAEADTEHINRLLYARKRKGGDDRDGLLRIAEQLATLVRGGTVAKGAPPPEISPREHSAARLITWCRDQGWSEEQIHKELCHRGFTKDEIARLGELRLRSPE